MQHRLLWPWWDLSSTFGKFAGALAYYGRDMVSRGKKGLANVKWVVDHD